LDNLDTDKRCRPRNDCHGIVMFNVLSEELNDAYCKNSPCIKGIARVINMNDDGMMISMIDMLGLTDNLKGFSFNKFKGTTIEFSKPNDGSIIKAEVMHVSDNSIGVRYL
jgi:hypothetical protein